MSSIINCRAGVAVLALALWLIGNWSYKSTPSFERPLEVALAVPAQLLVAFGDRYLAANLGTWRSIVLGGVQLPDYALQTLSAIQVDAAWLNPAQEDNYYTANAILPWSGFIDETQFILEAATAARRDDVLPPFMLGLNRLYFQGDADGAVAALKNAADKAQDPGAREYFLQMSNYWQNAGDDIDQSISLMKKMAKTNRNEKASRFVDVRMQRLEGLRSLRQAHSKYQAEKGYPPATLDALLADGYLSAMPADPTGLGYKLINGRVVLASHPASYRLRSRETLLP